MDPQDPTWSFTTAAGAEPEQLFAWLEESIAVSDTVVADALAGPDGLSALSEEQEDGQRVSLRWIRAISSRSTRATTATPTCSASPSTASRGVAVSRR